MTAAMNDLLVTVTDLAIEGDQVIAYVDELHTVHSDLRSWRNSSYVHPVAQAQLDALIGRFESTLSKLDKLTGRGCKPEPSVPAAVTAVSPP